MALQPLTDKDMILLLQDMARSLETRDPTIAVQLQQVADRLAVLSTAEKIAQHKAIQG